jgi:hypothetical protein
MSVFNPTEASTPLTTVSSPPPRGVKRKRTRGDDSETNTPCPPKVNDYFSDGHPTPIPIPAPVETKAQTPTIQAAPTLLTIDTISRLTVGAPPVQTALTTVPKVYNAILELTRSVRMMLKNDIQLLLLALDEFLDSLRSSLRGARKHFSHRRAKENAKRIRAASGRFFASVGKKARENGEAFSVKMKAVKVGLAEGYKQKVVLRQKIRQRKQAWKARKQALLRNQGKFSERSGGRDGERNEQGYEVFRGYVI